MQLAVEQNDERKMYEYFCKIADSTKYKHNTDFDDWKQEAVVRAFRYAPQYTKERGAAFSYFYRIIVMQLTYEYRRTKMCKEGRTEKVDLDENLPYEQKFGDEQELISIGGYLLDKDFVRKVFNEANVERTHRAMNMRELLDGAGYVSKHQRRKWGEQRKHRHENVLQEQDLERFCKEDI